MKSARFKLRLRASAEVVALRAEHIVALLIAKSAARRREVMAGAAHIVVAAPGRGSIGDEAMLKALDENIAGTVLVIARSPDDIRSTLDPDTLVEYLPNLLYGSPLLHLRDLARFAGMARSAASVTVIGADTMDGVYSRVSAVRRFRVAAFAQSLGVDSRVAGFSWNTAPDPLARRAMRWASGRTSLLVRDPKSHERILADGATKAILVTDLAFLTRPAPIRDDGLIQFLERAATQDRPLILVNANWHLEAAYPNQFAAYVELLRYGSRLGWAFVLVPHDWSGSKPDYRYLALMRDEVPEAHAYLPDYQLDPGEVITLAEAAHVAVSGRMHFAILCSLGKTPVACLSYQDKMVGLFERLGCGEVLAELEPGFDGLARATNELLGALDYGREQLTVRVPDLVNESLANLPRPQPGYQESGALTIALPESDHSA